MLPRNQTLLCACLVFVAALGWILHQPPAGGPTTASTTWREAPEIRSTARGSGMSADALAGRGILHIADKQAAPVVSPPLPDDFLQRILSADEKSVTIQLPGGGTAQGLVSLIRRDDDGPLLVQGAITLPEPGHFMFQRQTIPGKAGSLVGFIYYDKSEIAYQVRPVGENGKPVLVKTTVDSVICRAYAAPRDADEIPASHPIDDPIPPGENGVIQLQSLPGATAVVYLDFNGEERNFDGWGYINAASSGASNAQIFEVWQGVCEDYQPFQINVTTVRAVYDAAPPGHRMQVIITPTSTASPGAGGVAYLGSFNWTGEPVCWSFILTGKYAVDVISHEVGHTLGLSHDGRTAPYYEEYYQGANGWAPIMGVSYYQPLTQWSKGEYPFANNPQDDVQAISSNNNGVAYRADDHGASFPTATWMSIASGGAVTNEGIIETNADRDSFRFSTTGGNVTLQVNPVPVPYANLDIKAEILSVTSTLITTIATSDPTDSLGAFFTGLNLPAGDYLLRVSGSGNPVKGYTNYASLGSYTIAGTVNNGIRADSFTLAENPPDNTVVGTVPPRASHGGGALAYAITAGDGGAAFSIHPATGVITVADGALLDFEAFSSRWDDPAALEFFVTISDSLDFATETIRVVVTLTDVNEAPDFPTPPATVIPANLPPGMVVATVSATDPDRGDYVSYAIAAGNDDGLFAIDPATGVITLAAPLNFQNTPVHILTLRAADHRLPINEVDATLTISLLDVPAEFTPGSVIRTFYNGIEGSSVASLTGSTRFPDKPNSEVVLGSFDSGVNQGSNYGSTVCGYLIVPATGEYTFWISADETAELLISPDSNPANAVVHASVSAPANPGEWTKELGQQSAAIELTAGGIHYIEARHKEAYGNDHVQVAWQGPGMAAREIIHGRWLAPHHQQHAPWAAEQSLTVRDSATANTLVGRVPFIEPNIGEEVSTYAITAGNEAGFFTIDAASGDIRVATGATLTAGDQHALTVSATDDGSPPATGGTPVNISVIGLNEQLHTWWRLDESSGSTVHDSSGNARNAYLFGNGSWVPRSATNQALQLNGTNARAQYFGGDGISGATSFSLAAWVKVPATHAADAVLIQQAGSYDDGGSGRYQVTVRADGRINFRIYGADANGVNEGFQFNITSAEAIHDGTWHHVACVRDGATGRIFIDGVENASGSGAIRMLSGYYYTTVGSDSNGTAAFLNATVDDLRIYADALGNEQIVKVASVPVFGADPIIAPDATEDAAYSGTIADSATDPDPGDTLSFSKTGGPDWLAVATDGALSGMPDNSDVGLNIFTVRVTDAAGAYAEAALNITVINTNDQPAFAGNPLTGDDATEDVSYSGTIAGSATDPDGGDTLNYSKTDGPDWLLVATDGALSGMPDNSDVGLNIFTVRVTDAAGAYAETTLNITVINTNDQPAFASNPLTGDDATEDVSYSATIADAASDPDLGDILSFSKTDGPDWLAVATDGALSGMPDNSDVGLNIFTVRVTDAAGAYAETTLNITVINTNDQPAFDSNPLIGTDATEDEAYSGTIAGSATDPDLGDTLSFSKTDGPDWLTVATDGALAGTPGAGDVGPNSFMVRVTDTDGLSADAELLIEVRFANQAPVFLSDPITATDAVATIPYVGGSLAAYADDPNLTQGDSLTFTKTTGADWLEIAADGTLSGTPLLSDLGPHIFTVRVTDLAGTFAEAALQITVNAPPPVISVTATDPDAAETGPDNGAFTITRSAWLVGELTVNFTLSGTAANGVDFVEIPGSLIMADGAETSTLNVTPQVDDFVEGPETVILTLAGGDYEISGEAATVTITDSNHAPSFDGDPLTGDDATEDVSYSGTIADAATDPDAGDTLGFSKTDGPDWLTVATDGALSGMPDNSDVGLNIFTVRVTDAAGAYAETTLNITVINTNDQPAFDSNPLTGDDATEDVSYSGTIADAASDPDLGDTLSYSKTDGPDWLLVATDGALSGMPDNSDVGLNIFTVRVTDAAGAYAEAALNITVINTNDQPAFAGNPLIGTDATEDAPYSGTIAGSATDPDLGDTLSFSKTGGPDWLTVATDGALAGTPGAGDVGPNSFMVRVTDADGLSADAELLIEVRFANQAPVFLSDPITVTDAVATIPYAGGALAAHVDDPNLTQGDSLTFTKTTGADWLEIAADGTLSGTPLASDLGSNIFTVRVTDLAGTFAEAALQITVNAPPPLISVTATDPDAAETGPDNGAFTITRSVWLVGELTVNFTISGTAANGVDFVEIPGSVIMADGAETATLSVIPEADVSVEGPETVILTLAGGDYQISGEAATVTIADSNHTPSFDGDPLTGDDATEDVSYSGTIADAANDPDAGDTLGFSITDGPDWLTVATDGALSGMPDNSNVGLNVFTVRVTDAAGAYAETTLNITVINVNDAPVFASATIPGGDAIKGIPYSGTIADAASDPDADDILSFSKTDGPEWLEVASNGSLSGTPPESNPEPYSFTVRVTDTLGAFAEATLQIAVAPTVLYLDANAGDPGSGAPVAVDWEQAFWSATADGTGETTYAWIPGATAVLSAGDDAGPCDISISGTLSLGGLTVEEGAPVLTGGALALAETAAVFDITGTAVIGSEITGANLIKTGAGTLSLGNPANSLTGALTVSNGRLDLTGSLAVVGGVGVESGGTLTGVGPVTGDVTVSGTLAPGDGTGALTTGALALSGSPRLEWRLDDWTGAAGSGHDLITAESLDLTNATTVTVAIDGGTPANFLDEAASFLVIDTTSGITEFDAGKFVIDASALTAVTGHWTLRENGGDLLLDYTPLTPFEAWQLASFGLENSGNVLISGPTADPDLDGIVNLVEYATGGEPLQPGPANCLCESIPPVLEYDPENPEAPPTQVEPGFLRMTFQINPAATDVSFLIETSENLADPDGWSDGAAFIQEMTADHIVIHDMLAGPRRFFRLRVTLP